MLIIFEGTRTKNESLIELRYFMHLYVVLAKLNKLTCITFMKANRSKLFLHLTIYKYFKLAAAAEELDKYLC